MASLLHISIFWFCEKIVKAFRELNKLQQTRHVADISRIQWKFSLHLKIAFKDKRNFCLKSIANNSEAARLHQAGIKFKIILQSPAVSEC